MPVYDLTDPDFPHPAPSLEAAREVLRRTFGHSDFRGLQAGVITELLEGRSALAVLPTGGGKSLCYQIPALVRPGLGLVVSPLIALMADQVAGLQQAGVAAERLDSNTLPAERSEIWRRIDAGMLDLLYLSPEGLMQPSMLERLSRLPLSLVAVDEAHCVSQWGHDFRPEYRMLGRLAEVFPNAPRLAVTATADARTRDDIRAELRLQGAAEFVDSFARHELALNAERKKGKGHDRVIELVTDRPNRAGVVYAGSRDSTEKLAEKLICQGIPALAYHAGLDKNLRARRLEEFLEAEEAVMVATIAFGMGVDKPDVRFVIHADPPAAIEAYWQEIGRAGRDRQPAEGITLYSSADLAWAVRRIEAQSAPDEVKAVQLRKLRQFYAMLEGVTCRAAAVPLFRRGGRRALRGLRHLHLAADRRGRHPGRPESLVGRPPHGRTVRARPSGRPPSGQDQGRHPVRGDYVDLRHRQGVQPARLARPDRHPGVRGAAEGRPQ